MPNNTYYYLRHSLTTRYELTKMIENTLLKNDHYHTTKDGYKLIEKNLKLFFKKVKRLDLILTSPFNRTKEIAKSYSDYYNCPIKIDQRLSEIKSRRTEGMSINKIPPSLWKKTMNERPLHSESYNDVRRRLFSLMKELDKKYKNKHVLLVSHGDPLWLLTHVAAGHSDKQILTAAKKMGAYPKFAQPTKLNWLTIKRSALGEKLQNSKKF